MSPSPYEPATARFSQVCPEVVAAPQTGEGTMLFLRSVASHSEALV